MLKVKHAGDDFVEFQLAHCATLIPVWHAALTVPCVERADWQQLYARQYRAAPGGASSPVGTVDAC